MVTKLGAKMKRQEMRRKKTKAKRMGNLNLSSFSEISMSERGKSRNLGTGERQSDDDG